MPAAVDINPSGWKEGNLCLCCYKRFCVFPSCLGSDHWEQISTILLDIFSFLVTIEWTRKRPNQMLPNLCTSLLVYMDHFKVASLERCKEREMRILYHTLYRTGAVLRLVFVVDIASLSMQKQSGKTCFAFSPLYVISLACDRRNPGYTCAIELGYLQT